MSCSQPKMARYNVDRVVHLANILGGPASEKAVPYLRVQCMGTANVFEACRIHGVSRVVYVSSVAVYGGIPNRDQEVRRWSLDLIASMELQALGGAYLRDIPTDMAST